MSRQDRNIVQLYARYAQLAFVLPTSTFVGWALGSWLDRYFGTHFLYLVLLLLGLGALIKRLFTGKRSDAEEGKPAAPQETVAKSTPLAAKPTASVPSDPKSVPSFLPVHVVADSSVRPGVCPTGVLIELGPGCCIRVEPRFDAQVLRQVVQALAGAQAC